jgi:hypothetical protein
MTLKEAGVTPEQIPQTPDWHTQLTDEQFAAYVRYQYIRLYSLDWDWDSPAHNKTRVNWDGGKDRFGVKHKPVWSKITRIIRQFKADPGLWVAAQFSDISCAKTVAQTHTVPDIRPTNLASAEALGVYEQYCLKTPTALQRAFEVAGATIATRLRGTLSSGMTPDDQVFYVLCDESYVSASPFFRYVFAEQLNCPRAVERYLWRAAIDYEAQQRIYQSALKAEPCASPTL